MICYIIYIPQICRERCERRACKKVQKNEKSTVLASVYIATVNVLFHIKCAILHRYQCVILHLVFDFNLGM